ncbi:MAG: tRNA (adenosine(37)-N6)-dimethylallyltransferase MiaA [Paracoccaceae bacterium]
MRPPILIAGPTASGKSELALALAERDGGCVINADALQVYSCWRVLTARPSAADERRAPHRLYGTVARESAYSVGDWLRDAAEVLAECRKLHLRPIFVGGTGLYFSALTEGLAAIPQVSAEIRVLGNTIRETEGASGFVRRLADLDPETLAQTDRNNAVRLQRAWEVATGTGRGLASWQRDTGPPLLPMERARAVVLRSDPAKANTRISARLERMICEGALEECAAAMAVGWSPALQSARALGAPELVSHLAGEISLEAAKEKIVVKTRRYAKRQRTWFRNRMANWTWLDAAHCEAAELARQIE